MTKLAPAAMMAGTAIVLGLLGVTLLLASAQAMECAGLMLDTHNDAPDIEDDGFITVHGL